MRKIKPPKFPLTPDLFTLGMQEPLARAIERGEMPLPVTDKGLYEHWDKVRYLAPPDGLTVEKYWQDLKLARIARANTLPLADADNKEFLFCQIDQLTEFQHWLDKQAAGVIGMPSPNALDDKSKTRFLMNGRADEAIHSSILEGAVTTRKDARKILKRKNPRPTDDSQRMIVNNYHAMEFIEQHQQESLSVSMILELHKVITRDTLDNPTDAGNLRQSDDVVVHDNFDGRVVHRPPPASELWARLQQLCDFANDEKKFIHPALRAMILHFMLAYIHPFVDGNGRTARALFYREMMRHDYWLIEYVSISAVIKKAPRKYYRAFVYTETDENDMTYFLLHQAQVIRDAFKWLNLHIRRQQRVMKKTAHWEEVIRIGKFNRRQAALLLHATQNSGTSFTAGGHRAHHHVTHATAQADLKKLTKLGWLVCTKIGKEYIYTPCDDLSERLNAGG